MFHFVKIYQPCNDLSLELTSSMLIFYLQYEKQSAELTFQLDQLSDRLEEAVGSSTSIVSFSSIHIRRD
jgi:hypothetical protein